MVMKFFPFFRNNRVLTQHTTCVSTSYVDNRHLHDTDMESINGNKIDEMRLKYLIHRGKCSDIGNGNMDDFIRKAEFGGREDVTRSEIEPWYEERREDEKNFENHLLSKFFPDRDDVIWIELDEKRWEHAREREAAEFAALYPEYAAEKRINEYYNLLSNTWIMAFADVVC
ncbi:hypothetical protein NA56DRAFT_706686 [Hyaloscypha hepaticicola]|uniref:Uncharacterized protein n=1 Tax=Hyaloscypha hepaticicola TaxID=2082293 RepID=A0A2J6PWP7_9HELO|nr:hypothetical protein NA56DRAFT_706686 [Hyaloscypha hepaticicola]